MGAGRNLCISLCYRLEMAFSFARYISLYHNLSTVTCLLFNGDFHIVFSTWLAIWSLINSFPLQYDKGIQIISAMKLVFWKKVKLTIEFWNISFSITLQFVYTKWYMPSETSHRSQRQTHTSEGTQIPIVSVKSLLLMPGFFFSFLVSCFSPHCDIHTSLEMPHFRA